MRKQQNVYYFSVEGDTEKWYLQWLMQIINADEHSRFLVKFNIKIEKDPLSFVKRMAIISKTEITHIFDYEGNSEKDRKVFTNVLDKMCKAEKQGKNIIYNLGYSNLTFELWILLHRANCNNYISNKVHYLKSINQYFNKKFTDLDEYKSEDNFKKLLAELSLDDVIQAISRAKNIEKLRAETDEKKQYGRYKYYETNPHVSLWMQIEKILKDVGIINKDL